MSSRTYQQMQAEKEKKAMILLQIAQFAQNQVAVNRVSSQFGTTGIHRAAGFSKFKAFLRSYPQLFNMIGENEKKLKVVWKQLPPNNKRPCVYYAVDKSLCTSNNCTYAHDDTTQNNNNNNNNQSTPTITSTTAPTTASTSTTAPHPKTADIISASTISSNLPPLHPTTPTTNTANKLEIVDCVDFLRVSGYLIYFLSIARLWAYLYHYL